MKIQWDFSEFDKFAENLEDTHKFDQYLTNAANQIAKTLRRMLKTNTPLDYGNLRAHWDIDNPGFVARKVVGGFEILLVNNAYYATWVNDGHKQRPGRFIPGYWQGRHFRYVPWYKFGGMVLKKPWVKGRFFVEVSLAQLENSRHLESIIYKQLQNWWRVL